MPAVALVLGDPVSDLALGGQDDTSILQVITDKFNQFINNNLNLIDLFVDIRAMGGRRKKDR